MLARRHSKLPKLRLLSLEDRTVPAALGVVDPGFEMPAMSLGTFQYKPTDSPWIFLSGAGVTSNASGFSAGNPLAPQGTQALFLQRQGSASQTMTLAAGAYTFSFSAAQRGNLASAQTFSVLLDGTVIGTFNNLTGTSYLSLTTSSVNLAAGLHTLAFQGTNINGGDNTVLIDNIELNKLDANITDSGFEMLSLSPGTFQYNPANQAWTFDGGSGITNNGSGFSSGNAAIPQGNQAAFLQKLGSMSEAVGFVAGTYAIRFAASQRANMPSNQTFQVLIDDQVVGTFNNLTGSAYTLLSTSSFTIAGGVHTVAFKGTNLNGGDNTVFIDQVEITKQATDLDDSGFETPAIKNGSFQYNPPGSAWTFTGASGIATNGSGFTVGNPAAPQGNQVLFLQKLGIASQSFNMTAGTYTLSFAAAQRGDRASSQTLQLLVDGNVVGTFNNIASSGYATFTTSSFTVGDGQHTIVLKGTNINGGDNTILIDQVSITQQSNNLSDSGFEAPPVNTKNFAYNPAGSAWTFTNGSGLSANGSGFTSGNPDTAQGNQVAFLQGRSSVGQMLALTEGTYAVQFLAAQRGNLPSTQTLNVLIDGNVVGTFNALRGTSYVTLTTSSFVLAAGNHTLTFTATNLNGGDNTMFIDQVAVITPASAINDAGFEQPTLAAGAFAYIPSGSPWTFTGTAGVAANGSGFTSGNQNAPQGLQVAVLQKLGTMSEVVPFVAGNYTISFKAAQRANGGGRQTFQVLIDGTVVGNYNNLTDTNYVSLTTSTFAVTSGNHTIQFKGTNQIGGDNTVFIDQVTINPM